MHTAVKGCFKDHNPKFKETIDMLIALGADSTVKNGREETAEQFAMAKLLTAFIDFDSKDYVVLADNFESCEECVTKKEEFMNEKNVPLKHRYWSKFKTIFSECNECFQTFKDELRCYHSTW